MDPASRLRSARLAAGLTQAALADRAGLGRVTLTRYETRAVMPAANTYLALIAACRTPDHTPLDEHDRALLDAQLARSPEARLHASHELARLRVAAARG